MKVVVERTTWDGKKFRKEIETDIEKLDLTNSVSVSVDLSPLEKCTELRELNLTKKQLASVDLSPLEKCTKL